MTRTGWLPAVLLLLCLSGCDSAPDRDTPATPTGGPGATVTVRLGDRPFRLHLPTSYDTRTPMPLVVALHGYTSNAADMESYFRLTAESDRRGFLYALPDGTKNAGGNRFWNATDACCDFNGKGVDDSGYLHRLIGAVTAAYPVDAGRVYVIGHSNGGFMAHRLACDHASAVTAIVSFAGALWSDPARCKPDRPVTVLQIHGTADTTIRFDGGNNGGGPYPPVGETLAQWRRHDGCADRAESAAAPLDLEPTLPGAETTVTTYAAGCKAGTRVVLWSINDGSHVPALAPGFATAVMDFLLNR